ncbi:hypothetical protein MA6G0125S_5475 [Mycobacteroides abscessus 6G-0125-S]|nr:hypothetical protein MA6G0125S_5475 [Mycobacteroides abscessus 6G-0125-S]
MIHGESRPNVGVTSCPADGWAAHRWGRGVVQVAVTRITHQYMYNMY